MNNIELIPGSKKIHKELWRNALLLDGSTGIQLGYIGDIQNVHHFLAEYSEGYRGFYYSDEEIMEKAQSVVSILPDSMVINFGIVRHSK